MKNVQICNQKLRTGKKAGTFLNCENHHSGVVKSTIQDCVESQLQNGEKSQFRNDENHKSRISRITIPKW